MSYHYFLKACRQDCHHGSRRPDRIHRTEGLHREFSASYSRPRRSDCLVQRWWEDLTSANNTLAVFKARLEQGGASVGFQPTTSNPFVNSYLFETTVENLASELIGWR